MFKIEVFFIAFRTRRRKEVGEKVGVGETRVAYAKSGEDGFFSTGATFRRVPESWNGFDSS